MAAANDELQRGWNFTTGLIGAGSGVSIIVPAVPGIVHVLTSIHSEFIGGGAAAAAGVRIAAFIYHLHAVEAVNNQVDVFDWNGKYSGNIGAQLVIDWSVVVPAACDGLLTIQGYDL